VFGEEVLSEGCEGEWLQPIKVEETPAISSKNLADLKKGINARFSD
jgi:hypothetical protein